MDKWTDEILYELIAEEEEFERKRQGIIANGCPHSEKKNHTGLFSGVEFKYCIICNKQFDLNDKPI
ncbi:hypothetical protein [Paenibacillus sp. FSL H3-0333]|uniref:hypothetical protein n=1 Tax=Paenibacillus sp. FSL H3-0333 TaxID=2921373 RepID=UPI0030FB4953